MRLWRQAILYRRKRLADFSVQDIRMEYVDAIEHVARMVSGERMAAQAVAVSANAAAAAAARNEIALVDLMFEACEFERATGNEEGAIARVMTVLECTCFAKHLSEKYNIECLAHGQYSLARQAFRSYWDSGSPRLGEADTQGYLDHCKKQDIFQKIMDKKKSANEDDNPQRKAVEATTIDDENRAAAQAFGNTSARRRGK